SPTSAGNLEWFVHTFMPDAPNPYDRCNAMVEALGKAETNVQFLPYLFSSNLGDNLSACFYGLANAHGLDQVEGVDADVRRHQRAAPRGHARQGIRLPRRGDRGGGGFGRLRLLRRSDGRDVPGRDHGAAGSPRRAALPRQVRRIPEPRRASGQAAGAAMSSTQQEQAAGAPGNPLGIYEKALPKELSWMARLSLAQALGFDFVEMSIDETDEKLARLDWSAAGRASLRAAIAETGVTVPS